MNALQIRRLAPRDSIDELTSLVHRALAAFGRRGLKCTGVEQSIETTERRARRGECFVALADARLVGTMTLETPDRRSDCRWYRRADVASLHQLAVDPRAQRLGYGSELPKAAERWACERGHAELALETPVAAEPLVAFYRGQGFRSVEQVRKSGKDYVSVVLSKTVRRPLGGADLWFSPHRASWPGVLTLS